LEQKTAPIQAIAPATLAAAADAVAVPATQATMAAVTVLQATAVAVAAVVAATKRHGNRRYFSCFFPRIYYDPRSSFVKGTLIER
jgi:hypothetical protein